MRTYLATVGRGKSRLTFESCFFFLKKTVNKPSFALSLKRIFSHSLIVNYHDASELVPSALCWRCAERRLVEGATSIRESGAHPLPFVMSSRERHVLPLRPSAKEALLSECVASAFRPHTRACSSCVCAPWPLTLCASLSFARPQGDV